MTVGGQPVQNQSAFLPTTTVLPKDQDELLIRLTKNHADFANTVNIREIAIYEVTETLTGQQWTNPGQPTNRRQTFRTIFNVTLLNNGDIAPSETVTFAHKISGLKFATNIFASCTSNNQLFFNVIYPNAYLTATDLSFTNPLSTAPLIQVFLICEYLKN